MASNENDLTMCDRSGRDMENGNDSMQVDEENYSTPVAVAPTRFTAARSTSWRSMLDPHWADGRFGVERPLTATCDGTGSGPDHYTSTTYPSLPITSDSYYDDWQYTMRRSMQEIVPNVFLGPYSAASRSALDTLVSAGITHIICVRLTAEQRLVRTNFPDRFHYLVIECEDKPTESIIRFFKAVIDFINEGLNSGGKVLLHGNTGNSRSPTFMMAYLMNRYGVTAYEAYAYVIARRCCISPNEGFLNQLLEYEPIYKALHVIPKELPNPEELTYRAPAIKRSYSEDEDEVEMEGGDENNSNKIMPSTTTDEVNSGDSMDQD